MIRLMTFVLWLTLMSAPAAHGADALAPIVGTWQSNVTNGRSARSSCAWTPVHTAVVCDQTITSPDGEQHATDLFTFDAATRKYVFYLLMHPGDAMQPVPLKIEGQQWIYGGDKPGPDGVTYRTVNDFAEAPDAYSWTRQSSTDGRTWKTIAGGRSTRVRTGG